MFGWHVHEKAVLLVLVPLRYVLSLIKTEAFELIVAYSLLAAENNAFFRTFVIASVAGIFSLFPLLFTPAGKVLLTNISGLLMIRSTETLVKVVYSIIWAVSVFTPLQKKVYEYVLNTLTS